MRNLPLRANLSSVVLASWRPDLWRRWVGLMNSMVGDIARERLVEERNAFLAGHDIGSTDAVLELFLAAKEAERGL